ncbi:hypothetical protein MED193_06289 [Roseobacter sp. MED193]|uniref:hypothetical protein n=1 Tax=Roseobacter sp. MED193 TaxID=314262 RepID=UPI000068EE8C|nr:hypothetical protein [Roseobacter sp. MED193]EAQ45979.1 hypothetical protein MED193_06289 [Roseobacter sp. MED193]
MLTKNSTLIFNYFDEGRRLMREHLESDPYESLKQNVYSASFLSLLEHTLTPMMSERRIRVWHYTHLLNDEIASMQRRLVPSSLIGLEQRLESLINRRVISKQEAQIIYDQSPFHQQGGLRSNRVYTTTVPFSPEYPGVVPLLQSWGGESAYFWLSDEVIAAKLKTIGTPRIVEIETALEDEMNAYSSARTATEAWARTLDVAVEVLSSDLAIIDCLDTAKVLRVHTAGDGVFEKLAASYPSEYKSQFTN